MHPFVAEHLDGLRLTKIVVELDHEPRIPPKALAQEGQPGQWHFGNGLPADERLVSLGGSGLGVRRRFPETPLTPCDGDFLASTQTVSQSAGLGASVPCVRHGSQAADVDRRQLVG